MKTFIRAAVDRTLLPLFSYLYRNIVPNPDANRYSVPKEIFNRAILESADYYQSNMRPAMVFKDRARLWRLAASEAKVQGLIAEFGVFEGDSINYFADLFKRPIFGFDSFEGLQEAWRGHELLKGAFDRGGQLPAVKPNVTLIKGWFQDTLPGFLASNAGDFSFIHIDCDTYESTKTILWHARPRLVKGTVILFDEYFGYPGWQNNEFQAWKEFVAEFGLTYEYLGVSTYQAAVRVC